MTAEPSEDLVRGVPVSRLRQIIQDPDFSRSVILISQIPDQKKPSPALEELHEVELRLEKQYPTYNERITAYMVYFSPSLFPQIVSPEVE